MVSHTVPHEELQKCPPNYKDKTLTTKQTSKTVGILYPLF